MYVVFSCGRGEDMTPQARDCIIVEEEEDAVRVLQEEWENFFNDALANEVKKMKENYLDMEHTYHEEEYAVVTFSDGSYREWILGRNVMVAHKKERLLSRQ